MQKRLVINLKSPFLSVKEGENILHLPESFDAFIAEYSKLDGSEAAVKAAKAQILKAVPGFNDDIWLDMVAQIEKGQVKGDAAKVVSVLLALENMRVGGKAKSNTQEAYAQAIVKVYDEADATEAAEAAAAIEQPLPTPDEPAAEEAVTEPAPDMQVIATGNGGLISGNLEQAVRAHLKASQKTNAAIETVGTLQKQLLEVSGAQLEALQELTGIKVTEETK